MKELQHRYAQIGLGETPGAGASAADEVDDDAGSVCWSRLWAATRVYVGMRNWHPYIADVIAQMRVDGVTHIKAICLAPQNSRTSVGLYRRAVMEAAAGLEVDFVAGWAESPLLVAGVRGEAAAGLGRGLRGVGAAGSGAVYCA